MNAIKDKILVVDDEEGAHELLCEILPELTDNCYDVSHAFNGAEALSLFKSNQYTLVISDIRMPIMDGMQLLQEIKMIRPNANVIMLTAYGELETYEQAMRLGASEFITKPVSIIELQRKIRRNLRAQRNRVENCGVKLGFIASSFRTTCRTYWCRFFNRDKARHVTKS